MDDRRAQRAFGGVVGRLDRVGGGKGPERWPDLEEVVGELAVPAGAPALRAGVFEQLSQFGLDRGDLGPELVAVVVLVLVGAPCRELAAGELGAGLAERLLFCSVQVTLIGGNSQIW